MNNSDDFKLVQQHCDERSAKLATQALLTYEKVNSDPEIKFLPVVSSIVSSIYKLTNGTLKLALDEIFPSLKIGSSVLYFTRKDNPRVIEVYAGKDSKLIESIVSLVNSINISSLERAKSFNELIDAGLAKQIKCDPTKFVSTLLRVDEKTLRRDLNNAK